MTERTRLFWLMGVMAVILISLITFLGYPLVIGTDVVLSTKPVDPFDPLRGQFVTIRYDIGELPALPLISAGDTVYTKISPDTNGVWQADGLGTEPPAEGVFLRGTVDRNDAETLFITYGIEQYFFERNADVNLTNMTVHARVSADGTARIVELLHNGVPVSFK